MDSLERELLFRDLELYGYQLSHPGASDPAAVLQRMVASEDGRILEGVPVVLSNILMAGKRINLESVENDLPLALQKRFRILSALTHLLLVQVSGSEQARKVLKQYLKNREPALLEQTEEKLRRQHKIQIGKGLVLDEDRVNSTYRNYVLEQFSSANVSNQIEKQRSRMLDEALDELFTDKQKQVIFKVLKQEALTKTEREYYSRVIKPRLKAIRNTDLQAMATTLLGV